MTKIEEVKKILNKVYLFGQADRFTSDYLPAYINQKTNEICQLFQKTEDNPDGYKPITLDK